MDHQGLPPEQYLRLFEGKLPENYPYYLDDDQLYHLYDGNTYLSESVNLYNSNAPDAVAALAKLETAMAEVSATLPHSSGEFTSTRR